MKAETVYSHTVRVVACAKCGAPLVAEIRGGAFRCDYCGTTNRIDPRDEKQDRAEAARTKSISESERYARLREQQNQGDPMPESLLALTSDGELRPERVQDAKQEWLAARTALDRAPSFPSSERLFFLTVLLTPHLSEREQRAMLETAIERLTDGGHRHILRCMLSRRAARFGDREAAADWLEPCDQRPLDLRMDTAFRYATATLAAASGKPDQVLALLGSRPGDVPLATRDALGCTLLRIDALAKTGELDAATEQYRALSERIGDRLDGALSRRRPMDLCRVPRLRVEAKAVREEIEWAEAQRRKLRRSPQEQILAVLVPAVLVALCIGVGFASLQATTRLRVVPRPPVDEWVCANTCPSCVPPIRSGVNHRWLCTRSGAPHGGSGALGVSPVLQYVTNMAVAATISFPFWLLLMLFQLFRATRARHRRDMLWHARIVGHGEELRRVEAALYRETGRR